MGSNFPNMWHPQICTVLILNSYTIILYTTCMYKALPHKPWLPNSNSWLFLGSSSISCFVPFAFQTSSLTENCGHRAGILCALHLCSHCFNCVPAWELAFGGGLLWGLGSVEGFPAGTWALMSHFSNKRQSLSTWEASSCSKAHEFLKLPFEFAFRRHSQSRTISLVIFWAGRVRDFRCRMCANYVDTTEVNESQRHYHVKCTHLYVFATQGLFLSPLSKMWWKNFKWRSLSFLFWLKPSDYSLSSCYLDGRDLCMRRD